MYKLLPNGMFERMGSTEGEEMTKEMIEEIAKEMTKKTIGINFFGVNTDDKGNKWIYYKDGNNKEYAIQTESTAGGGRVKPKTLKRGNPTLLTLKKTKTHLQWLKEKRLTKYKRNNIRRTKKNCTSKK